MNQENKGRGLKEILSRQENEGVNKLLNYPAMANTIQWDSNSFAKRELTIDDVKRLYDELEDNTPKTIVLATVEIWKRMRETGHPIGDWTDDQIEERNWLGVIGEFEHYICAVCDGLGNTVKILTPDHFESGGSLIVQNEDLAIGMSMKHPKTL